jgi:hypothetical protein
MAGSGSRRLKPGNLNTDADRTRTIEKPARRSQRRMSAGA